MQKKILSILIAIVMILTIAPVSAFAQDDILSYLNYNINNGEVTITGCDDSISGEVVIPDTIEGYPVTSIGNAFFACDALTSITIGNGVTSIGSSAFFSCDALTNITVDENNAYYSSDEYGVLFNKDKTELIQYSTGNDRTEYIIPDSVTSIGWYSFYDCDALTSITIPDSVTSIGSYAFYNTAYYNNESNWENGVLYINNHLIEAKDDITECTIKEGILTIADFAFSYCNELESVTIPDSVISIGNFAFYDCDALESVTIPDSVTSIGDYAFGYYFDENTLLDCLVDGFTIYGYAGTAAETYANENGITFIALEPGDDVVVPDEPVTEEPVPDEPVTEEPIPDEPVTEEPTPDEPVTEEPTPDEPVQDKESNVLKPNVDSHIFVADTVATINPETDLSSFRGQIENKNVQIIDADGNELATDAFVGTGAKINILDTDGKVLSTYEIMVKSDVDGNGKVTPADARLALRAAAGLDTLAGVYETAANFDEKDTISTSDARMILRKAAGLE